MSITRGYDLTMNPRYWPARWQRMFSEIVVITKDHDGTEEYWATWREFPDEEPRRFKSLDDLDRYVIAAQRMDS